MVAPGAGGRPGGVDGRAGHGPSADACYRIEDELRYPVATG
jgi:hypothetical protein